MDRKSNWIFSDLIQTISLSYESSFETKEQTYILLRLSFKDGHKIVSNSMFRVSLVFNDIISLLMLLKKKMYMNRSLISF